MSFVPLMVVVGLAFLVPIFLARLGKRLSIPLVVGEILAGIAVGDSGLRLVEATAVLRTIAELGFVVLMFLSGLEIEFGGAGVGKRSSASWWSNPLITGGMHFCLSLVLAAVAAWGLAKVGLIAHPWFVSLVLVTTSLGVVAPVLKERGLAPTPVRQTILVSTVIADLLSLILISTYVIIRGKGMSKEILLVLVLLAVFLVTFRLALLCRDHLPARPRSREVSTTTQIRLRGTLVIALAFIVLAEALGLETIIGAFLAGAIVSLALGNEGSALREKLDALGYGFLIPVFFVMVGVELDLRKVLASGSSLASVSALVGVAYVVKVTPSLLLFRGFGRRNALAGGILMSSRLSLIIAAAAIGLQLGILNEVLHSAFVLVAVITSIASPPLFCQLVEGCGAGQRVCVIGSSSQAELLVDRLRHRGLKPMAIPTAGLTWEDGALPATVHDALRAVAQEPTGAVLVLENRDQDCLQICRAARLTLQIESVVAVVEDPRWNEQFRALGVRVVNPSFATILMMEQLLLESRADAGRVAAEEAPGSEGSDEGRREPDLMPDLMPDIMPDLMPDMPDPNVEPLPMAHHLQKVALDPSLRAGSESGSHQGARRRRVMRQSEKRSHGRVPITLAASRRGESRSPLGRIKNISFQGVQLQKEAEWTQIRGNVAMHFVLPERNFAVNCCAEVVYEKDGVLGLRFTDVPEEAQRHIDVYVSQRLAGAWFQ